MNTLLFLGLVALFTLIAGLIVRIVGRAPLGYEDETGFHEGKEKR